MTIIKCSKCNGTGKIESGEKFKGYSSLCKVCGFTAFGSTQVVSKTW